MSVKIENWDVMHARMIGPKEGRKWENWRLEVLLPKTPKGRPWEIGSANGDLTVTVNVWVREGKRLVVDIRRLLTGKKKRT
jgi:hypothetical protein